ncbi:hypothetical protein [Rubrobacter xylanophilus]|nr:hypothetical protein [Rubrobacter xylanophilus]
MSSTRRAGIAGVAGMAVALGVTELAHGLHAAVPSCWPRWRRGS